MESPGEKLDRLYERITFHSPVALSVALPGDGCEGQVFQGRARQGVLLSDWRMRYTQDMDVQGRSEANQVQLIFCGPEGIWGRTGPCG